MKIVRFSMLMTCAAASALAQGWEFGAVGGYSLLNDVSVTAPTGTATAGFAPGFVAGAFAGENISNRLSGEIRYEFMQSDLKLSAAGQTAQFSGVAHAIHYDFVFHASRGESPVQFFASVGGGAKIFDATGAAQAYQPLSQYGYFTDTHSIKPMGTVAAGLSFRIGPKLVLRTEIRDYMSSFPEAVLTPPPGVKYGGFLNEIVPMVSLVYSK